MQPTSFTTSFDPFALQFYNRPPAFALWASGTALLFLFLWSSGGSIDDARHTGHFYLFFIACWWLSASFPKRDQPQPRWFAHIKKYAKSDFRFLLLAQLTFGIFAYSLDIVYPFSANQATAAYLRKHHLQNVALVAPESVAEAMGRSAYFPQYNRVATFIPFRERRMPGYLPHPTKAQITQRTLNFIDANGQNSDVVVVGAHSSKEAYLQKYFLWRSAPTLISSEQFTVYLIPRGAIN